MKAIRAIIFLSVSLFTVSAFSQQVKVSSSLDKNAIMIGEQFHLKLTVQQPSKFHVVWPSLSDTITNHIEIVEIGKGDTTFSEDKTNVTYNRDYLLTSFDSGAYTIPAFPFITPGGEIFTNPLFIKVNRPAVDTTKGIRDIKAPLEVPFDWKEFIPHVLIGFGVVLLIVAIIYLIIYYRRKKRRERENKPAYVPPPIPAHEKALTSLRELDEKHLWQQGRNKEYYTELTDILRVYIKDVYQIDAPEMLTDEILQHLKFKEINPAHKQALKTVLELSDMVKFAKVSPTPTENAQSFEVSVHFVQDTAPVVKSKEETKADKNTEEGGTNGL